MPSQSNLTFDAFLDIGRFFNLRVYCQKWDLFPALQDCQSWFPQGFYESLYTNSFLFDQFMQFFLKTVLRHLINYILRIGGENVKLERNSFYRE